MSEHVTKVANKVVETPVTFSKAIRLKCLDCCAGLVLEVKECTTTTCPLYLFRSGRNKSKPRAPISEEQRLKAAERLRKARENIKK